MAAERIAPHQSYFMPKIGVYTASQPSESEPSYFVPLEEARRLKKENKAFFIHHGTAIRLIGPAKIEIPEERQKTGWKPIPSGTMAIGFVDVLQLV